MNSIETKLSSAKQFISKILLAATSRAKYYKIMPMVTFEPWTPDVIVTCELLTTAPIYQGLATNLTLAKPFVDQTSKGSCLGSEILDPLALDLRIFVEIFPFCAYSVCLPQAIILPTVPRPQTDQTFCLTDGHRWRKRSKSPRRGRPLKRRRRGKRTRGSRISRQPGGKQRSRRTWRRSG